MEECFRDNGEIDYSSIVYDTEKGDELSPCVIKEIKKTLLPPTILERTQ